MDGTDRDAPWYPVSGLRRFRCKVEIMWNGRLDFGLLEPPNKRVRQNHWVVWDKRRECLRALNPNKSRYAEIVECWRPLAGEAWPDPLPLPLTPTLGPNYRSGEDPEPPLDEPGQVWRVRPPLVYSEPGSISRHEAEHRVMRAAAVAGAGLWTGAPRSSAVQAIYGYGLEELAEEIRALMMRMTDPRTAVSLEAVPVRFVPLEEDKRDWLTAMAWFAALERVEQRHKDRKSWALNRWQRLIVWRGASPPVSFKRCGEMLSRPPGPGQRQRRGRGGLTKPRAIQLYREAIDRIWLIANDMGHQLLGPRVDQIEALRERNREWKRVNGGQS